MKLLIDTWKPSMEQLKALGGRAAWTGAHLWVDQKGWRLPLSQDPSLKSMLHCAMLSAWGWPRIR